MARKPSKQNPSSDTPEEPLELTPKINEEPSAPIQPTPEGNGRKVSELPHGAKIENF